MSDTYSSGGITYTDSGDTHTDSTASEVDVASEFGARCFSGSRGQENMDFVPERLAQCLAAQGRAVSRHSRGSDTNSDTTK